MKKNVGTVDRYSRLGVAFAIIVLTLAGVFTGVWAVSLCVIAAYFLFTGIFGLCFFYNLIGIHTLRTKSGPDD